MPLMQCNSCIVEHPAENFGVVPQILLSRVRKLGKVKQLEASKKFLGLMLPPLI